MKDMSHPLPKSHILVKRYRKFANFLKMTSNKNFQRFMLWIQHYIQLKFNEKEFNAVYCNDFISNMTDIEDDL